MARPRSTARASWSVRGRGTDGISGVETGIGTRKYGVEGRAVATVYDATLNRMGTVLIVTGCSLN